jgi:hypothetical protein
VRCRRVMAPGRGTLAAGCALAILLGGCGGANSENAKGGGSSGDRTPTIVQPGAQSGSLAAVKQRLEAAGYSPEEGPAGGNAVQNLEVDGVSIAAYRMEAAATADYEGVRAVLRKYPGRGVVRLFGAHLYQFGRPRSLTPAERARFEKIVRIGEASQ